MKQPEEQQHYDSNKALIDENQVRGGKITVKDVTARDNWPLDKRKIGMFVTIGTATKRYGGADVTNTNWTNANNWYSILDKDYGDSLYKRKKTEFIVENVIIDENLVEVDVYTLTKLYMNGRFAFNVVAYATDPTPEKVVEIEVLPISAAKFSVKQKTDGFTGKVTLFVSFQEIVWDYEGVMDIGFLNPYSGYSIGTGFLTYGSVSPTYPYTNTGVYAGNRRFNWRNTSPFDMNVTGNLFAVEVNGIIYIANYYDSSINSTLFIPGPTPYSLMNGQTCIVKVKTN